METSTTAVAAPGERLTLVEGMARALSAGRGPAQRFLDGGTWTDLSYAELYARAQAIAHGLLGLGIGVGDRVALVSRTRAEWTQADLGALLTGATLVPVYETNSAGEVRYILEHSGARLVFCEDAGQVDKLDEGGRPASVKHVVLLRGDHPGATTTLDALAADGAGGDPQRLEAVRAGIGPDDLSTLVYTSGTTGPPKGCRLSHHALWSNANMVIEHLPLRPGGVFFAFLPLAHVLTRMVQMVALRVDGCLAYWNGSMESIADDLAAIRPTHLPSVPRVFEKGYARARATAAEGGRARLAIFDAAASVGRREAAYRRRGEKPPPGLRLAFRAADRLVLSRVREVFGGRVELAVCGGAPIDARVLDFFDGCGIPVLEGYGMTETSAVSTFNPMEGRRFGTVGPALPGSEVAIAPDGEVLLRGPHIFSGYEADEEATAAALRDGWLHTGDLGVLDEDGYLTLVGRKKEIVVTSSGKNVSPANVELAICGSPWISQAVAHGDRRPFLTALISLDPAESPRLAAELGIEDTRPEALATDERVHAALREAVAAVNVRFAPIEQVKRFTVLSRELTLEQGEVTASMKIKRGFVQERFAADLARLYDGERGPADVWLERAPARTPEP